jgi:hypothetical protein
VVVVFWFVKCNKGNIFVFLKLIISKNKNSGKVNGKLFFMIKKWTMVHGFTNALSHKRYGGHHTIDIKDYNKVHIQMNSYGHHVLYRDVLVIHLSHTPPRWEFNLVISVLR